MRLVDLCARLHYLFRYALGAGGCEGARADTGWYSFAFGAGDIIRPYRYFSILFKIYDLYLIKSQSHHCMHARTIFASHNSASNNATFRSNGCGEQDSDMNGGRERAGEWRRCGAVSFVSAASPRPKNDAHAGAPAGEVQVLCVRAGSWWACAAFSPSPSPYHASLYLRRPPRQERGGVLAESV